MNPLFDEVVRLKLGLIREEFQNKPLCQEEFSRLRKSLRELEEFCTIYGGCYNFAIDVSDRDIKISAWLEKR